MKLPVILLAAVAAAFVPRVHAEEVASKVNARLMQMPAVSKDRIAFVYAGDIWVAPKEGGQAIRLSSPRGGAEQFPRFSPDGGKIAFSGNYEGNTDIYVMPVTGGEPLRLTYHGAADRLLGWWPDGKSILFRSDRESFTQRVGQFYKIPASGGLAERLPVPYGEFGAVSPDGKMLAYTPITTDFATWKHYRGGMAPDIWLFDLEKLTAEVIAPNPAKDSQPMWHGEKLYFLSDRDEHSRDNIWVYDTTTKAVRQLTKFVDFDVKFPSIGPDSIVFENGGKLWLFDLATEQSHPVEITVVTDDATRRPRVENIGGMVRNAAVGPTGKRVLFEARGDIFSVPAEHGIIRNLTETPGVAERYPAWSPDGKTLAYFSDNTGEYELTIRPADYKGAEETITKLGPGYRYHPYWSPDSKKIVFIDSAMRIHLVDVLAKTQQVIDKQLWSYQSALEEFRVSWSSDSRWLTYAAEQDNRQSAIVIYDTQEGKRHQVTSAFFDDEMPVFDPDGKYLYYRSQRWFDPAYSSFDHTWIYANGQALVCIPLRNDLASPLAPRDDEENAAKAEEKKAEDKPADDRKDEPNKDDAPNKAVVSMDAAKPNEQKPSDAKPVEKVSISHASKAKPLRIDLDGFESRAVVLPPGGGHFDNLIAVSGKLIFQRRPRVGAGGGTSPLSFYDLEKREEKQIIDDANGVDLSADGKKLLISRGGQWGLINVAEGQKLDKPLATSQIEMTVDPGQEWKQLFTEAWRIERDFFYDPGMHGVNWNQMRERYGQLIDQCATRSDVNYVIGELIGELNSSHTYRSGGDITHEPARSVGYLGCDYSFEQGAYRIKSIPEVAPWESTVRSPLRTPGVNVKEGDWLLAVNGRPIDVTKEPYAAFQGLADKPVLLTVNDKPTREGAREVLVQTIGSEHSLRQYAWIEANRRKVELLSGGRIGYIYVPDTGHEGQNQLYRMWRAQFTKQALLVDERWNGGGQIPDRFIELLSRKILNYYGVRDGKDWQTPFYAHHGPKVMLANSWSGSGGDCFPYLFQQNKLGPVIGTRTWGGLIGMTGAPALIDGGSVTVPTFGIYDTTGKWIIEGHGVDPDIEVLDDPAKLAHGNDPQLERGVDELLKSLKEQSPTDPPKPAYPRRAVD
jgi:tricorn protease